MNSVDLALQIALITFGMDQSGTMTEHLPDSQLLFEECTEVARKQAGSAANSIYVQQVKLSGKAFFSEIEPITKVKPLEIESGGTSPQGQMFTATIGRLRPFRSLAQSKKSVIRCERFLYMGDLISSYETLEEMNNGFADLLAYMKEFKVKTTLIVPQGSYDTNNAARLVEGGCELCELGKFEPNEIKEMVLQSVTGVSRVMAR